MSIKGIVMETNRGRATVMLPGGLFKEVPTRGLDVQVGQEIWLPQTRKRWYRWLAVPAAAAVVAGFWIEAAAPAQPAEAAVLSVDINPSINLDVSSKGVVLGAKGLDRGGRRLLTQQRVRGLTVQQAVDTLIQRAARDGYLHGHGSTVLIGAVFLHHPESWFSGLSTAASGVLEANRVTASVVAVSGVSASLMQAMQKPEVSVGRYLVWQRTPRRARRQLTLHEVQKMSVADLLAPLDGVHRTVVSHTVTPRTSTPKVSHTPSHSVSTSTKHSGRKAHPGLPNLPVTVPTMVVTPPTHGLHNRGEKKGQSGQQPKTPSPSKVPTSSPSHQAPNPVNTVSSLVGHLGL